MTRTESPTTQHQTMDRESAGPEGPIPVTILSGFLGSGKTTLLKYILESCEHELKIAVIVNDMAELNIDASVIRNTTSIVQTEREVVSLQNGCICCTLRGDLIREIARIQQTDDFDYVLIESTGIAEPQAVAQAFVYDPDTAELASTDDQMLWKQARLDTCVTVVDAHSFSDQMASLEQFGDQYEDGFDPSTPEGRQEGERSISDLLIEQVEFANLLLLNKTDLVSEEEQSQTIQQLRSLNPSAKIITTEYCKVDDLNELLNTNLFDMVKASSSAGWIQSVRDNNDHTTSLTKKSEVDEYGVTSFVYRARLPFYPDRIAGWVDSIMHNPQSWKRMTKNSRRRASSSNSSSNMDIKQEMMKKHYGTILRTKGFCWLAHHDSFMMGLAQSGRIGTLHPIMPWYVCLPNKESGGWGVPPDSEDQKRIEAKFESPHGDRRQEIVFIGTNLNVANIQYQLDTCLMTPDELKEYEFYSDKRALGK